MHNHGAAPLDLTNLALAVGVIGALVLVFLAALALPAMPGWRRGVMRAAFGVGGAGLVLLANLALYRHDMHLDLTRERAFTPSAEAVRVVRALDQPVSLTYFYQKQNPAARLTKTMVELLGKMNPNLAVRVVDPDQNPGLANQLGARIYNTAVLIGAGRKETVVTTDDREIALGILRLLRADAKTVCFVDGHGEYDIDNFEFHTHFEGSHAHSHDIQGTAVVQMEQHGLGRLRRALEKLGLSARKVTLAGGHRVPADCAALVDANPRTTHAPPESLVLSDYLQRGGAFLLLVEPDYEVEPGLAALLARAGVKLAPGVVVDPTDHYFTDNQMIAVTKYARHPITPQLALSFFPGIRPVLPVPAEGVQPVVLFASSASSYVIADRLRAAEQANDAPRGARPLAVASEGKLAPDAKRFRLVVAGDADFASNSFFPYLSNADLVLAAVGWLLGEERAPTMKPPVEVLPTVTLTNDQVRGIFLVTVIVMPGLLMLAGIVMWWVRR